MIRIDLARGQIEGYNYMYHIPSILFPSSELRLGILSNKSAADLDTDKCFVFGRIIICNNSKRGFTLAGREEGVDAATM